MSARRPRRFAASVYVGTPSCVLEPPNKPIRVVVDTNVWISALLSATRFASPTRALLNAYRDRRFSAVISRPLLRELATVAVRPRLSKRVPTWNRDTEALLALLEREPMVAITGTPYGCRDPNDDAVIETAIAGRVEYLVTGDQDLLDVHVAVALNAHGILITTARALVLKVAEQGSGQGE